MWLRQSTVQVVSFGPFLDKGNGVDLETGLISALDHAVTGIMLSKNGGALAVREQGGNFVASTYDAHGCYRVSLSAVDTGTLGRLRVIYTDPAVNLPVWQDYQVIPAQVWDSLCGTDKLEVAVVEQADIDFGALQKDSLDAATPASVQNLTQGATAGDVASALSALLLALQGADGPTLLEIEAILTAIKGAGWTTETLAALAAAITGLNNLSQAQAQAGAAAALTAYDPPTRTEATADKEEVLAAVATRATLGAGAISWPYTLIRSDNGLPIPDADVWITTDISGSNVIASGRTNQNGVVTFYLDAGTVYVWRQKAGFDFTNPDTEVVS